MINNDISSFRLSVKEEGREKECFKNHVLGVSREGKVDDLHPATSYVIKVAAIYKDGIEKERSVTFENFSKFLFCSLTKALFSCIHQTEALQIKLK